METIMRKETTLQEEEFKNIYTDEKFRNEVAYANSHCDTRGNLLYFGTLSYPKVYIVSKEQKDKALKEIERSKAEFIANYKSGELVFMAMGGDFNNGHSDIQNHRIRAEFKNIEGHRYFIELLYVDNKTFKSTFFCDFSVDRDMEEDYNDKLSDCYDEMSKLKRHSPEWERLNLLREKYSDQPYYNAFGIGKKAFAEDFTKENVLKLINSTFNCNYKTLYVDRYTLSTDDICSECNKRGV